jgi:murein DD-endopeptidase MepM/ murein hydrolase activator NlpD
MKSRGKKTMRGFVSGIIVGFVVFSLLGTTSSIHAAPGDSLDDLNAQIEESKNKLDDIKKQAAIYQKNIRIKQEEALSLSNQMDILSNQIAKTRLDVEATQEEIKKAELEIRETELQILDAEDSIEAKQQDLSSTLREIHANDQTNYLEIFVLNESISDFFNHAENTRLLSQNLQSTVNRVKVLKQQFEDKKDGLSEKRDELAKLEKELLLAKAELEGELTYKDNLLAETEESEDAFYNMFWEAKREQEQANSEIYNIERQIRERLDQGTDDLDEPIELTDSTLIWPVPQNKVTAYFHDKSYPFRNIFEHPAIDIRAAQGTSTRAAADGYVLKAKDNGYGYSYIAILHADGLSTVYGHMSKIFVRADEYVQKGEIIGLSGGMPGSLGAGNLTTGPHMHFEVRLNGIPVDPLLYLP